MWEYEIHYNDIVRAVKVPFTPYKNDLAYLNDSNVENAKWDLVGINSLKLDFNHPIVSTRGIAIISDDHEDMEASMIRIVELKPNTKYLISIEMRNDGIVSTRLFLNGEMSGHTSEKFSTRIAGVITTDDTGEVTLEVRFNDRYGVHAGWIDGFFATEIPEAQQSMSKFQLMEYYPYVSTEKKTPTGYDVLKLALHGAPYQYSLSYQGIEMPFVIEELGDRGIPNGATLEVGVQNHSRAINAAFTADKAMMSMLEGDYNRVTHAFPKQDSTMSTYDKAHFPRVQFFTGDGVGKIYADARPFAEMINFTMNFYVPITKALPSVTAAMIAEQASAIMADMGWSKVRGSDYFMTQEQMYVLQTQFIKDTIVKQIKK